ncbi:MAG TPA: EF-Tu/IF-2/RF-3 family GTPase, partial [Desulfosalsimonadaceae bacterium]|nr:EF-Tu/IF-2/RF-3 family GTPase [Desulfosalsimonadaceae bacterium]
MQVTDIEPQYLESARKYREKIVEQVAETDDDLMEAFLEERPIETEDLMPAIRRATLRLSLVPVLCGAALRNKGIQPLLDAVVRFLPSPVEAPPIEGRHPETEEALSFPAREKGPLVALIFKVSMFEGRKLSFVRIYSGFLKAGSEVYNTSLRRKEKVSRILRMHANKRERLDTAGPGSIVGVVGLKDSGTGHTLCDPDSPVLLEAIEYYKPVISVSVEPKTHDDQDKLEHTLAKLMDEDPTLHVKQDEDTGQTILSGMGELHLDIVISRMKREYNTNVNVGRPQVVYRETLARSARSDAEFDREIAGNRHYAAVELKARPLPRGSGNSFRSEVKAGKIPEEYIPAISQGVSDAMEYGELMGYPMADVEVVATGGDYKEAFASELAYKVCATMACREAFGRGEPYLLEPIMDAEVFVPEDFMGEVIGDLNARGGKIESISAKGEIQVISASVPLSKMFGYSTALRSVSQGRGNFTMKFSHFDNV